MIEILCCFLREKRTRIKHFSTAHQVSSAAAKHERHNSARRRGDLTTERKRCNREQVMSRCALYKGSEHRWNRHVIERKVKQWHRDQAHRRRDFVNANESKIH